MQAMTLSGVITMDACIFNVELAKYIRKQVILLVIYKLSNT